MNREEAIKWLEAELRAWENDCKSKHPVKEALDMAIEALKQEPCGDAIDRKLVCAFIDGLISDDGEREKGLEYIRNMPPVNPTKTGWIPVSERLPEESLNSVIGWDAYRERCVFVQYIDGYFQITGSAESFDIVAWMPLPKPYEPQERSDKE